MRRMRYGTINPKWLPFRMQSLRWALFHGSNTPMNEHQSSHTIKSSWKTYSLPIWSKFNGGTSAAVCWRKKIIVQFLMFPAFNPTVKQSRVALELTRPVGHWVEGPCIHESVSKSKFTEEFRGNGPILKKNKKMAWNKLHVNHSCFDHTINH